MMSKPAQIASLRQYCQSIDWTNPRDRDQELVVGIILELFNSTVFDLGALCNQVTAFTEGQTKHSGRIGIGSNRQTNR